jgi:TPR repeat protein
MSATLAYEMGNFGRPDGPLALAGYDEMCDAGETAGCLAAGLLLEHGDLVKADLARALQFDRRACDRGAASGCFNAGRYLAHGWSGREDQLGAQRLFERGCELDDRESCARVAIILRGHGGTDYKRGRELAQRACPQPIAAFRVCRALGEYLVDEGKIEEAATIFERECDHGGWDSCTELGWLLERGKGISQDDRRALLLYRTGCRPLYGNGCYQLGRHFEKGIGVSIDVARAARLYDQACDNDISEGCAARDRLSPGDSTKTHVQTEPQPRGHSMTKVPSGFDGPSIVFAGWTHDLVRRTIQSHGDEVNACFGDRTPDPKGRVMMEFTLTAGKVHNPFVRDSSVGDESIDRCVLQALSGWTFPVTPALRDAVYSYPFSFAAPQPVHEGEYKSVAPHIANSWVLSSPPPHLPDRVKLSRRENRLTGRYLVFVELDGRVSRVETLTSIPDADPSIIQHIQQTWTFKSQPYRFKFLATLVYSITN